MFNIENISIDEVIKFLKENKDSLKIKKDYYGATSLSIVDNKNYIDSPYLPELTITIDSIYNDKYGDNRMCECGHSYYRHFDSYEDMSASGCKYCGCYNFKEAVKNEEDE